MSSPFKSLCPFSVVLFVASAALIVHQKKQKQPQKSEKEVSSLPTCRVVFVLGGPGAGKGTQCQLLKEWTHLSAGDLLRAARKQGHPLADTINSCIAQGKLVPSEVTCQLLERAMTEAYKQTKLTKFLVDGFPRSHENATVWENTMSKHKVEFVLLLECPEEVLIGRLLERSQTSGRVDDNIQVIRKRFVTYQEQTAPILEYYEKQGKVRKILADQPVDKVHQEIMKLFDQME